MAQPIQYIYEDVVKVEVREPWDNLHLDNMVFAGLLFVVQVTFFVYAGVTGMTYSVPSDLNPQFYAMFIDVSIMIFFGFGFLMTFLRRHGFSAVGLCVMTSCVVVQLSLVMQGLLQDGLPQGGDVNLFTLINGLFCAGAVMISMGAVLGKLSPSQLLFMGIIETVLYFVNFSLYTKTLGAHDAAGGIVLHAFGAYFGLVVARFLSHEGNLEHKDNSSTYNSDMFSLTGTLFLWILWPSFCGAVSTDNLAMFYSVTNTFLGLVGSVVGFAFLSRFLHHGKFNIVEMQNATLAGGVAMGVAADYALTPSGALAIGIAAGMLSSFGYAHVDLSKIGVSDTCGVHNLHGMPGLLGGIVGLFLFDFKAQILGLLMTMGIAIVGGALTGALVGLLPDLGDDECFNDDAYWEVPDDYRKLD